MNIRRVRSRRSRFGLAVPPVAGLAGVPYLTNENVFGLTELPASLAVLGGGPVGCEPAQAFTRLGSQVTLVDAAPRPLPAADPDAAAVISEVFAAEGSPSAPARRWKP